MSQCTLHRDIVPLSAQPVLLRGHETIPCRPLITGLTVVAQVWLSEFYQYVFH